MAVTCAPVMSVHIFLCVYVYGSIVRSFDSIQFIWFCCIWVQTCLRWICLLLLSNLNLISTSSSFFLALLHRWPSEDDVSLLYCSLLLAIWYDNYTFQYFDIYFLACLFSFFPFSPVSRILYDDGLWSQLNYCLLFVVNTGIVNLLFIYSIVSFFFLLSFLFFKNRRVNISVSLLLLWYENEYGKKFCEERRNEKVIRRLFTVSP